MRRIKEVLRLKYELGLGQRQIAGDLALPPRHVLVCGAGVVGASVAYFLARRGVAVTVVERSGIACAASASRRPAQAFNIGFGALDLYQAAASRRGWFPKRWFRWRAADDALHVVVGTALIVAGLSARSLRPPER